MRVVGACWLICLGLLVAACGGQDAKDPPGVSTGGGDELDAEVEVPTCIDNDGDGYGKHCDLGADCDDGDPDATTECRRCGTTPTKDCPCKSGTRPLSCVPPTMQVEGGTLVCKEGSRYCRSGYWSDCESIGGYVLVPNP
jgi:hypothetical protein